jgi:hypothetical protein
MGKSIWVEGIRNNSVQEHSIIFQRKTLQSGKERKKRIEKNKNQYFFLAKEEGIQHVGSIRAADIFL